MQNGMRHALTTAKWIRLTLDGGSNIFEIGLVEIAITVSSEHSTCSPKHSP